MSDQQRQAEQALLDCIADDEFLSRIGDDSPCHGWAGLLHTTWRAAIEAGAARQLATEVPRLRAWMQLHLQRHTPMHAGLLEGTAGVRLVQHTTTANSPPITRWDACLLMDG